MIDDKLIAGQGTHELYTVFCKIKLLNEEFAGSPSRNEVSCLGNLYAGVVYYHPTAHGDSQPHSLFMAFAVVSLLALIRVFFFVGALSLFEGSTMVTSAAWKPFVAGKKMKETLASRSTINQSLFLGLTK